MEKEMEILYHRIDTLQSVQPKEGQSLELEEARKLIE